MRIVSLGSGSSGNAFILHTARTTILIDCGIGVRKIRAELANLEVTGQVNAVLISHEHIDHIRALESLMRNEDCPVFATAGTIRACPVHSNWHAVRCGDEFAVNEVGITPIKVSHDAAEPCGYMIRIDAFSAVFLTDLGISSVDVSAAVSQADLIVIESNYDETMLRSSPYPAALKRRIRGPLGHLSNDDCASVLAASVNSNDKSIWLAHLSENNNHPKIAVANVVTSLGFSKLNPEVQALPRRRPIDLLSANVS